MDFVLSYPDFYSASFPSQKDQVFLQLNNYANWADNAELQVPFDVALAPAHLEADDCPSQDIALTAAVFAQDTDHDAEHQFDDKPQNHEQKWIS